MINFDVITQYELPLLLFLNGSDSNYMDAVMWVVTKTITWLPLFVAMFYLVLRNLGWKRSLVVFVLVALLILVADQVASGICKPLFGRFRPSRDPQIGSLIDVVNGYRGGRFGFFSSHASNTFAAATFFSLLFRHRIVSVVLFLWAILCTYSRLYLGVHYPSDILVGLLFGIICGVGFHKIWLWISHTYFQGRFLQHPGASESSSSFFSGFRVLYCAFVLSCAYVLLKALWHVSSY